jgi:peptide/nickel transport system substrate-binding protein
MPYLTSRLRTLAAIGLAGAALLIAGCGGSSSSSSSKTTTVSAGNTTIPALRVGLEYNLSTLDLTQSTSANNGILNLWLDQLVEFGSGGTPQPWLAQSISQPNPSTYVYHLRQGVKFWDGNVMTANDVATSLNYWRSKGSQTAYLFGTVKSITAQGASTVVVTLLHPDSSWEYHLAAAPGIFEASFQAAHKSSFGKPGTLIMGTGPWRPISLDPTTGLQLVANPDYWHGPVNVKRISIIFFQTETSMAIAYRTGAIDLAFPYDGRAFKSASQAKMTYAPSPIPLMVAMNTIQAPWNDIHVRLAVAYALNRTAIAAALAQPVQPLSTIIPPNELYAIAPASDVNALLAQLPKYGYNPTLAKQEMAESSHPSGFTFTLTTLQGFGFYDIAQVVAADLKPLGITVNIKIVPLDTWLSLLTGANRHESGLQLTTPSSGSFDVSDEPSFILGSVNTASGGFNIANWAPPDVDTLIDQGVRTPNGPARLAIYGKILQRVAQDVPYVPILLTSQAIALQSKFSWPTFRYYYINQPWALQISPN